MPLKVRREKYEPNLLSQLSCSAIATASFKASVCFNSEVCLQHERVRDLRHRRNQGKTTNNRGIHSL
jgi:hypothetical protein